MRAHLNVMDAAIRLSPNTNTIFQLTHLSHMHEGRCLARAPREAGDVVSLVFFSC
jgi:hypothetical protein